MDATDVIQRHGYLEYAIEKAPFKFGGLFGVFGLAREVAMEDADGQCSTFSREVRRFVMEMAGKLICACVRRAWWAGGGCAKRRQEAWQEGQK